MSTSDDTTTTAPKLSINIKGPQDTKLSIQVAIAATVAELKQLIATENENFPADSQRLIYSGRVLKDEDLLSKYALKDGHTVHLVKGARPTPAPSAASAIPSSFAAGQQIAGNPLAPLLNAQNAGALAGFNPFAEMGINPNDPNYMQQMMNDPAVQANIGNLLQDPAVVDQMIASNPELQAMGPQVRQLMQSEQFRSFLTNPEAMRQMMALQSGMGGGNPGAMGAQGGFPPPGAFGWGTGAGAGAGAGAATGGTPPVPGLFNPWAQTPAAAAPPAAGAPGAFNPFGGAGAGGAGAENLQRMLAQMYGPGAGGMGPGFAPPAPTGPVISPEERYQVQLEQLAGMGFTDAANNVRALLASGGNVEGAIEWLFSNPRN